MPDVGGQDITHQEWQELVVRYAESRYIRPGSLRTSAFVDLLSVVSVAIIHGVSRHMLRAGDLTAGTLIAFLLYNSMMFSPILTLANLTGGSRRPAWLWNGWQGCYPPRRRHPDPGETGAGKSTMMKLLLRPVGGGAGGHHLN